MSAHCAPIPNLHPLYFIEHDFGALGHGFEPMDRDQMSRAEVVRLIRTGNIKPVKILEVYEPCEDFPRGQCLDVTDELIAAAEEERDPPSLEESCQKLRNMLAQADHDRDLRKHGVFGW